MQNKNLMKTIALAVSALIVEQISEDKNVIGKVTENVTKKAAFINSLTSKLEEQKDVIKQEIYQSLSFENARLKNNCIDLQEKCT